MPRYEFVCDECGEVSGIVRSIKVGPPESVICGCGSAMWHNLIGGGFILKGGGWPSKDISQMSDRGAIRELDQERAKQDRDDKAINKEVIKERRKGRNSYAKYTKSNRSKVERYKQNLNKGFKAK